MATDLVGSVEKPDHWNRLVNEVAHRMLLRAADMPPGLQTWVSAFNLACTSCMEACLFADDPLSAPLRVNLDQLSLEDTQHIYATLLFATLGLQKPNTPSHQWEAMMTLPEIVYHQPKSSVHRWVEFVPEHVDSEHFFGRLLYRINDEVNPVLGLDTSSPLTVALWASLLTNIASTTRHLNTERFAAANRTDIQNAMRAEHHRSSPGCGAAVLALGVGLLWFVAKAFAF